jgi:hypothetical protein
MQASPHRWAQGAAISWKEQSKCQLPTISRQPSAVSCQPPAISRQPSAASRQPSVVSRQPPAISQACQLHRVRCHPLPNEQHPLTSFLSCSWWCGVWPSCSPDVTVMNGWVESHCNLANRWRAQCPSTYICICYHSCPSISAIGPAPLGGGDKDISNNSGTNCIAHAPSVLQKHGNGIAHNCIFVIPQIQETNVATFQ